MKKLIAALLLALGTVANAAAADSILNRIGAVAGSALSTNEVAGGLKEALSAGLEKAVATLGKTNGFLADAAVKIAVPESLRSTEATLRKLRQDRLVDEFITTLNRAAEQAVPQAALTLADAVKQMSLTDAAGLLTSTNRSAATDFFRRTASTNLTARLLPIVKNATTAAGVTGAYKSMAAKASGGLSRFGGDAFGLKAPDLDGYVTQKALDGLFVKIAEQEKLIRENPSARTTELLKKVFALPAVR